MMVYLGSRKESKEIDGKGNSETVPLYLVCFEHL
jgi:hypothetical protein